MLLSKVRCEMHEAPVLPLNRNYEYGTERTNPHIKENVEYLCAALLLCMLRLLLELQNNFLSITSRSFNGRIFQNVWNSVAKCVQQPAGAGALRAVTQSTLAAAQLNKR